MSANALVAYQAGATGAGVKVGIIDSGIDLQSAEFTGRIDPASADFAASRGIDDEGGHGTAVAFTLAGRRNDVGTHGIAFDATLLILRTDNPGTCAATTPDDNNTCQHNDRNIATALDAARTNGARVVNISLGGSAPSQALVQAINRATAAGIIIVIAAGNDATPDPDPFAAVATVDAVSRNLVVIAGSVGTTDTISSFSDRAGTGAAHFLAAVGERVRAPDQNGQAFLFSGTSFAAPQIAGAAALLAQAFPNLTGAQIVDILFRSARDAGDPGLDGIYGQGILDLTRAFAPLGSTSLAGTAIAVSTGVNGSLSAPIGDAKQSGLGTVILDGYSRAFAINLSRSLSTARPTRPLSGALLGAYRNFAVAAGGATIAVTITDNGRETSAVRTLLRPEDAGRARALAASITARLGSNARFAIGFSQGAAALSANLVGRRDPAFLIATDPARAQGFASNAATSFALRQRLGAWGLTVSAENGAVLTEQLGDPRLQSGTQRTGYDRIALGLDRRFGALSAGLAASYLSEHDTVLGARFSEVLGASRARSWFVDADARLDFGHGWTLGGSIRQGWTLADIRAGLQGAGVINTTAFAADIGKYGLLGKQDSIGLRVSQPLRVARGGIDLRLPSFYDYATSSVSAFDTQRLNLTPTGRELDVEARYALPAFGGALQVNMFWRRDPGNIASIADDYGVALRYGAAF